MAFSVVGRIRGKPCAFLETKGLTYTFLKIFLKNSLIAVKWASKYTFQTEKKSILTSVLFLIAFFKKSGMDGKVHLSFKIIYKESRQGEVLS